jgi:hypothetical protein
MPVMIHEIVFKATITSPDEAPHPGRGAQSSLTADEIKTLVETCVMEILRILEREKER